MKTLVRIHSSCDFSVFPLFIVEAENEELMDGAIERAINRCTGYDDDQITVDESNVRWRSSQCWYQEDTQPLSNEDAEILVRILSLETYS
ncbi:TPA: hypothetical protein ACJJYX_004281 [Enterobacter cloacae]